MAAEQVVPSDMLTWDQQQSIWLAGAWHVDGMYSNSIPDGGRPNRTALATPLHKPRSASHGGGAQFWRWPFPLPLATRLVLATLSATRHNPAIKVFYDRLRDKGKPMKVARCTAARKLIHMAWAAVTKRTPYDPNYQSNRQLQLPIA